VSGSATRANQQHQQHGLVAVDKPAGWTSHDVVARMRRIFGQRRVGHAGTLDPDATGLLLVGLGRATRLLRFLSESGKEYRAHVMFGVATDTLDASGAVLERTEMPLTRAQLERATEAFTGTIAQVPPMVSALKVKGRRLYDLARAGEEVERKSRDVRIDEVEIEDFTAGGYPEATLRISCSSGTYIRSLAADLGTALGGCAHLVALRRLRIGSFRLEEARSLSEIEANPESVLLAPLEAVRDLERVHLHGEQERAIAHGATFAAHAVLPPDAGPGPFAVANADGVLLAVYERRGAGIKPAVVLATDAAGPL
jgi:tRNA pseudouridine55 synthase